MEKVQENEMFMNLDSLQITWLKPFMFLLYKYVFGLLNRYSSQAIIMLGSD